MNVTCRRCQQCKPITDFGARGSGVRGTCKACMSIAAAKIYRLRLAIAHTPDPAAHAFNRWPAAPARSVDPLGGLR